MSFFVFVLFFNKISNDYFELYINISIVDVNTKYKSAPND